MSLHVKQKIFPTSRTQSACFHCAIGYSILRTFYIRTTCDVLGIRESLSRPGSEFNGKEHIISPCTSEGQLQYH